MGERARTIALVVCLLLLSAVLAGLSGRVASPTAVTTVQVVPASGRLLVKVVMDQGTGSSSIGAPIDNANVTVAQASSAFHIPLVFQTNATGEFAISLATGPYTVTVSDPLFQNATGAVIRENMTTEVDVAVTRNSYPTLFSDLPDHDSSGSVAPWSYVSVAVNSSLGLPLKDPLFMDGYYGTTFTLVSSVGASAQGGNLTRGAGQSLTVFINSLSGLSEARAFLISYGLDPSAGSHVLWLTLQPESFLSLSGLVALVLSTYSSEVQVTTYAT